MSKRQRQCIEESYGKFPNLVNEVAIRCRRHLENQINMIKKEHALTQ